MMTETNAYWGNETLRRANEVALGKAGQKSSKSIIIVLNSNNNILPTMTNTWSSLFSSIDGAEALSADS